MDAASTAQQLHLPPQIPVMGNPAQQRFENNKINIFRIGITEIVLGVVSVVLGVVTIIVSDEPYHYGYRSDMGLSMVGAGIWCGAILVISGVVGVVARTQTTTGCLTGNVIMGILSLLSMLTLMIISFVGAFGGSEQFTLIFNMILAVVAIGGCIVAILHTCYSCSGSSGGNQQGRVIYTAVPQSQMVPVQMPNGQIMYYPSHALQQPIALHPNFQTMVASPPMAFVSPNPAMTPAPTGQLTQTQVFPQTAAQNPIAPVYPTANNAPVSQAPAPIPSAPVIPPYVGPSSSSQDPPPYVQPCVQPGLVISDPPATQFETSGLLQLESSKDVI